MPNPFDQFDTAPQASGGNPFDQFDDKSVATPPKTEDYTELADMSPAQVIRNASMGRIEHGKAIRYLASVGIDNPEAKIGGFGSKPQDENEARLGAAAQLANGYTANFGDEIAAGLSAPVIAIGSHLKGQPISLSGAYDAALEQNRVRQDTFAKQNELTSLGLNVLGGVAQGRDLGKVAAAIPGLSAVTGASAVRRIASAAAGGAALGGAAGFGAGEGVDNRLEQAKTGAEVGGAAGGIGSAAVEGISGIGSKAKQVLVGVDQKAAQELASQGIDVSQATAGNTVAKGYVRGVLANSLFGRGKINEAATRVGSQIDDALEKSISNVGNPEDFFAAGDKIRRGIDSSREAFKEQAGKLSTEWEGQVDKSQLASASNVLNLFNKVDPSVEGLQSVQAIRGVNAETQSLLKSVTDAVNEDSKAGKLTIGGLLQMRRDVGTQLATTPFSDTKQGILKQLYGALSSDVRAALEKQGTTTVKDGHVVLSKDGIFMQKGVFPDGGPQGDFVPNHGAATILSKKEAERVAAYNPDKYEVALASSSKFQQNDALAGFDRFNAFYSNGINELKSLDTKFGNGRSPEKAFNALVNGTKQDIQSVGTLLDRMTPVARQNLRASVLQRLGVPQGNNAVDALSTETFIKNYSKLSPQARVVLFKDKSQQAQFDLLARNWDRVSPLVRSIPENGFAGAAIAIDGSTVASALFASLSHPVALLAAGAKFGSDRLLSTMLTKPQLVKQANLAIQKGTPQAAKKLGYLFKKYGIITAATAGGLGSASQSNANSTVPSISSNVIPSSVKPDLSGDLKNSANTTPTDKPAFSLDSYIKNVFKAEGTGKNSRSTAQGVGQFTNGTWIDEYKAEFPDKAASMNKGQILAQRDNPQVAQQVLKGFTQRNANALDNAGLPVTGGTVYATHFAGRAGGAELVSSDPRKLVSAVLGPAAIEANPFLKGVRVRDLLAATEIASNTGKPLARILKTMRS